MLGRRWGWEKPWVAGDGERFEAHAEHLRGEPAEPVLRKVELLQGFQLSDLGRDEREFVRSYSASVSVEEKHKEGKTHVG